MGAPWARYFRMKIPESKYRLDPGLRLLHTKNVCKKNLLSRYIYILKKMDVIRKKTWAVHGLRAHGKKRKTWACQKKNPGQIPFFLPQFWTPMFRLSLLPIDNFLEESSQLLLTTERIANIRRHFIFGISSSSGHFRKWNIDFFLKHVWKKAYVWTFNVIWNPDFGPFSAEISLSLR